MPSIWDFINPTFGGGGGGMPSGGGSAPSGGSSSNTMSNILSAIGLGSSVVGGILNRPRGLSDVQKRILDQLMATLSAKATGPAVVDPRERAGLLEMIAQSATGARTRIRGDFAGRGLSESGLLGEELGRAERTAQSAQTAGELDLLRGARAEKAGAQSQLQSLLLGVPSLQGASAAGVGLQSIGQVLGYLLTLNSLGRRQSSNTGPSSSDLQRLLLTLTPGSI